VVIEGRAFLRECVRRSMESALSLPVVTYSSVLELERQRGEMSPGVVMLSWKDAANEASVGALKVLSELVPEVPVIVLAHKNDLDLARTAICHGAKGYVPITMGFDIAVGAVRFVLAGGTYLPVDCVLEGRTRIEESRSSTSAVTARELKVIHAIQQGKSNKVIAYELNMCESTVKVHVRNVMKKLNAKNRTEAAIKAQLGSPRGVGMPNVGRERAICP